MKEPIKAGQSVIMLGNEAVARGAWEAGVGVVSSYPGTPSTEITEALSAYPDTVCEWAPNEKVALETAVGASIAGARAMACMKHVGLNVAADPLFTAAYTGVRGGLVVVVADDPGMFSSQNEQDSRYYARSSHVPMLEPADAQEAKDFTRLAFSLSEQFDTPVFLRMTTRIAHSRSFVNACEREAVAVKDYARDIPKYVMMPNNARLRHVAVEARMRALGTYVNDMDINPVLTRGSDIGVVCTGAVYQYVREALPEASILKLGMVHPLPMQKIRAFSESVGELLVIEELEPYLEDAIRAAGIACSGKDRTGLQGELSVAKIAAAFAGGPAPRAEDGTLPARPPVLCPGCPHRAVFSVLSKMKLKAFGDIGCYTLGAAAPLGALDAVLCMGASLGMAHGAIQARPEWAGETIAVIGDSTFIHSGITGLINSVYNQSGTVTLLLDNSTTGMTGHQNHPANGKDLRGAPAPQVDLRLLCESLGAHVDVVDPFDMPLLEKVVREALARGKEGKTSVVIAKRPCALLDRTAKPAYACNVDACRNCGACMRLGCPAIERRDTHVEINASLCNGCGLCASVCRFGALEVGK